LRLLQNLDMNPDRKTKILGCQSSAANPLVKSWNLAGQRKWKPYDLRFLERWQGGYQKVEVGETAATAARIGNPVSRDKVMREIIASQGAMQVAKEWDLMEAVAVCGKDGIFVCPQTGIALSGVRNAVNKGWIKKGERVVVVSTATGLKFTEAAAAKLRTNIIEAENCQANTVAKILGID
jgi:threonine synthase